MKSTRNFRTTSTPPTNTPITQRRLKTKPVLILIAILLVGNLFWFILWLLPSKNHASGDEIVATVDGEVITRQQWLSAMETRYGKETLQGLVNEAVMDKAAAQYKIKVAEEEVDLELAFMRSSQDGTDTTIQNLSDKELRQKIRAQLILEKVLAKDIVIKEEAIESFYNENQSLFNIPTSYRTSLIVTESKEDAESALKELENGSEFSVLARERSLHTSSASLGGDIGFITSQQTNMDPAISAAVQKVKVKETSKPFVLSDGRYGIVYVEEVLEGQSFTYEEVKGHIERELAVEQLPSAVAPENFWEEFHATWFYGESK
ncbi:peptidyl-prolyl cis-trans isomerase [Solibacillus sp. CAU 1738]|uniref:peptidyl-prolyl cis-trans isomerase n=1 Tax=Solibacillus sp. CAU 1738 TaxID=3140363 RepID=UPI003260027B